MTGAAWAPGGGLPERDPWDRRLVLGARGLLRDFNQAGVLTAADLHVAERLAALAGVEDEQVRLAVALAVRAPRLGHVHVDLSRIRETAAVESDEPVELAALPWPEAVAWIQRVRECELVASELEAGETRPLRLHGSRLYLDRYWAEERGLARDLLAMNEPADPGPPGAGAGRGIATADPGQRLAAATALLRRFSVIAGGPGTGKTTTVARIVALLITRALRDGARPPLIALAAPTGKAAVRLEEAIHAEAGETHVSPEVREHMLALGASTLHRLLGRRPDSLSRFRHDRRERLPHDVVIVDETSMVPLSLMARLIEALRPQARLVLVGDPGQLASIEAGAVLGDIVGPAAGGLVMSTGARARLQAATGQAVSARDPGPGPCIGDGIVVLDRVHRFGGELARLAEAVRAGQTDIAIALLGTGSEALTWAPSEAHADAPASELEPLRAVAEPAALELVRAARAGDGAAALAALGRFRLLCAHRRGPHGVSGWSARIEAWLSAALPDFDPTPHWYPGRPLLVTENDYELGLFNGDTGVVLAREAERLSAAFERGGTVIEWSPTRLAAVETVYAMTIHKSQGSQFDVAVVLLPPPDSRILTRELLYTAITRARHRLIVTGSEAAIRAAIDRPIARASGLRERLWGPAAELALGDAAADPALRPSA